MSLQGIKLVTFDATNTLLKFRLPPWKYYAMVAGDFGYPVTYDCLKKPMKDSFKTMWTLYPNFGRQTMKWEEWWRKLVKLTLKEHVPPSEHLDAIANKLINEFKTSRCWGIAEGGEKLVTLLKQQGITVGVISNFDPRLKDILQAVGLYNYFEFVMTSYEAGVSKPDPKIYQAALGMCRGQVEPFEALHIGDDVKNDYEGARAAGWHSVLVNPNYNTETPPAYKHVFKSLETLSSSIAQNTLKL